jgi:hypothetical protein
MGNLEPGTVHRRAEQGLAEARLKRERLLKEVADAEKEIAIFERLLAEETKRNRASSVERQYIRDALVAMLTNAGGELKVSDILTRIKLVPGLDGGVERRTVTHILRTDHPSFQQGSKHGYWKLKT